MTAADLLGLLPVILTGTTALLVLLALAFSRSHALAAGLTVLGLGAALGSVALAFGVAPREISTLLVVDRYALFYTALVLAATLVVAVLSYGYLRRCRGQRGEFYVLLALAALGAVGLTASDHMASLLLSLEILSVSLFGLIAYRREATVALEAGVKYLVLAGVSSAFLVMGMALLYAEMGTLHLTKLAERLAAGPPPDALMLAGLAALLVGLAFKLALVPFHLWTPDVYQGASAPVAAFIATVSKGAVFALLLRYGTRLGLTARGPAATAFFLLAIASMFAGNLLALLQNNVKRILAYSSIAHLGYLLVAFLAAGPLAGVAVGFYLWGYFVASLGAFGVVAALSTGDREADRLEDFRHLAWRRPALAAVAAAMFLSLAGLPLTAGFIGKFYVLTAGVGSRLWTLVIVLVVNSTIGLFYYLRVVAEIFRPPAEPARTPQPPVAASTPWATALALAVLSAMLLWLGVWPAPAARWVAAMVQSLY